jgi:type IV secretory pathway VirB4 component
MGHLGLNRQQVRLIAAAVMKRHYYYAAPNSRNYRMFDLGLAPVAMSFVGASNKDDLKAIRALKEQHGAEWPAYWLHSRDLADWGEAWQEKYRGKTIGAQGTSPLSRGWAELHGSKTLGGESE